MGERTGRNNVESPSAPSAAGWRVWLTWVVASAAGWAVGGLIGVQLGPPTEAIGAGFVVVVAGSLMAGLLQAVVLRELGAAGWWVLATVCAVAAVSVLVVTVPVIDPGGGAAAAGTTLGVMQWMVLRRVVARAGWWVLASTVGWVAGGFLSGAFEPGFAGWLTIGSVYGAVTGAALVWLLRHRPPGNHPVAR